jgi:cysteine desulfurase family protein (TIGR01976 family)
MSIQAGDDMIRAHFPALSHTRDGRTPIFLDNPAGTQVALEVIDAMADYLLHDNANKDGAFATSARSDAMLREAHAALADFLGASSPDEIVFGPNMTTLTFAVTRAIGRTLKPRDELIVTHLDHDANIAPWLALQELGVTVKWVEVKREDCTLDLGSLEAALNERTRVVAAGYASNAVGTINDVRAIIDMAHAAGSLAFIDAVQYAPHGPIDVRELDCDLLACSAYKFYGPHVGLLYGKYDLLDRLQAYKVRPADDQPPGKFETGTQNHEGWAGVLGALKYFEWLGEQTADSRPQTRRERLVAAMTWIKEHERPLSRALIEGLLSIDGVKVWGVTDLERLDQRVPTVSFTMRNRSPREIAEYLARHDIYVWDGNYYALAIMEYLGLQSSGGMVRVGAVHYNTVAEIERLIDVLKSMP